MLIGLIFKALIGFLIGYAVNVLLIWCTSWKTFTVGLIGAGVYGGVIGCFSIAVTKPWPVWFVAIISIMLFVISQDFIIKKAEYFFRKNE